MVLFLIQFWPTNSVKLNPNFINAFFKKTTILQKNKLNFKKVIGFKNFCDQSNKDNIKKIDFEKVGETLNIKDLKKEIIEEDLHEMAKTYKPIEAIA